MKKDVFNLKPRMLRVPSNAAQLAPSVEQLVANHGTKEDERHRERA